MEKSDQMALLQALDENDIEKVKTTLEKQLDPNFTKDGKSPVCEAAKKGFKEALIQLLQNNAEPSQPDPGDLTWQRQPIHLATCAGHMSCVELLLEAGVQVNVRDGDSRTALHWACAHGHRDLADYLIQAGACISCTQVDGFTPLHVATCLGHTPVCELLLEHGAWVNLADHSGWTALHTASCYGHEPLVRCLLQHGATVDLLNCHEQESALHIATNCGRVNVVKLLLEHGASLDIKNFSGHTAFHLAVYQNKFTVAKCLASANADINTCNNNGQTPFYLAAVRVQEDFIKLMVNAGLDLQKEAWLRRRAYMYPTALKANQTLCLWLQHHCSNPRTFKDICSLQVRKLLGRNCMSSVRFLEIPELLKDYIVLPFL